MDKENRKMLKAMHPCLELQLEISISKRDVRHMYALQRGAQMQQKKGDATVSFHAHSGSGAPGS